MTGASMKNTVPAAMSTTGLANTESRAGKYLTFRLCKEEFAIEVTAIREIMGMQEITPTAQAAACVKGVINLRGKVIPVIDLRVKFGLPEAEYTPRTCIIVVQIECEATQTLIGAVVDGVSEVLTLKPCEIDDTPDFREGWDCPYVTGMAKIKGKIKILLDVNKVLSADEVSGLESVLN
jgi:purine-binding chemotaxis protein CheW